jgi:antitoxin CptB
MRTTDDIAGGAESVNRSCTMIDEKLVRWRCRRGMKELDLMLERFLASGYQALKPGERAVFARLLDAMDPDLFAWLSGGTGPDDPDLQHVIAVIRAKLTGVT